MTNPFSLLWAGQAGQLHGYNDAGEWLDLPLTYGIVFPGDTPALQTVTLTGAGAANRSYDTLVNTTIALAAEPDALAQLAGNLSVSFDGGQTFQALSTTPMLIPASAMGPNGVAGVIGPFDEASLIIRMLVPPGSSGSAPLSFRLAVDCDVQ